MSAKPVLQHAYVVNRLRAERGDLQALLSLVSMIQGDLASLGNLPSALSPLVKSLASEAESVKNYVWGFRDGRAFGQIDHARRLVSKKRKRSAA